MNLPRQPVEAHFLADDARTEAMLFAALSVPNRAGCVLRASSPEQALALLGRNGTIGLLIICGGLADGRGLRLIQALHKAGRLERVTVVLMDAPTARIRFESSGSPSLVLYEEPSEPRRLEELAGGASSWTLTRFS